MEWWVFRPLYLSHGGSLAIQNTLWKQGEFKHGGVIWSANCKIRDSISLQGVANMHPPSLLGLFRSMKSLCLFTIVDRYNLDGLVVLRSLVIYDYKRRCGDKNQRSTNLLCLRGCATLASDAYSLPCSAPPLCLHGNLESEPTMAESNNNVYG